MLTLQITAPFATFTNSRSREYAATYNYPTPATIYGVLLSLVGETNSRKHLGTKIAIGLLPHPKSRSLPKTVTTLRTFKRLKKPNINDATNSRPDYQEVLCNLNFVICVDSREDNNNLENRVQQALTQPENIERFGGLSIGESRDLIEELKILKEIPPSIQWLVKNAQGEITLPRWVDYQGSENTQWQSFNVGEFSQEAFCQIS
jgi:CRISPR-associated protein Cas5t